MTHCQAQHKTIAALLLRRKSKVHRVQVFEVIDRASSLRFRAKVFARTGGRKGQELTDIGFSTQFHVTREAQRMSEIDLTLSDKEDSLRSAKRLRCNPVSSDGVEVLDSLKASAEASLIEQSELSDGEDLVITSATGKVQDVQAFENLLLNFESWFPSCNILMLVPR